MKQSTPLLLDHARRAASMQRHAGVLHGGHLPTDAALVASVTGAACGRLLLRRAGGLHQLARLGRTELLRLGAGVRGATRLRAAFELGRRASLPLRLAGPICAPADAYRWVAPYLKHRRRECCVVLVLDSKNRPRHVSQVGLGGVNSCPVDFREVFGPALRERGASIIVAHNHPSGDLQPSVHDMQLTQRLRRAGELLRLPLLDHLVVAGAQFVSMASLGAFTPPYGCADQLAADTIGWA